MKTKIYTLAVAFVLLGTAAIAQEKTKAPVVNPNAVRVFYSDGTTLSFSDFFGIGLSDVITGAKRSGARSTGVFGVGYRYDLRAVKVGLDFGMAQTSSKVTLQGDNTESLKEKEMNFMILPAVDVRYFKKNLVELYGSASAGVCMARHMETALSPMGKQQINQDSKLSTSFAWQVNPIGLRVGNDRIGGFIEAGMGYKGFATAGISIGF